jgi:hypothetical protein
MKVISSLILFIELLHMSQCMYTLGTLLGRASCDLVNP